MICNENEGNLLRNKLIEQERNFAINLLKMQERTHKRTERMPTQVTLFGIPYFFEHLIGLIK